MIQINKNSNMIIKDTMQMLLHNTPIDNSKFFNNNITLNNQEEYYHNSSIEDNQITSNIKNRINGT